MSDNHPHALHDDSMRALDGLPAGAVGIDAGMTLTKLVHATGAGLELSVRHTAHVPDEFGRDEMSARAGVTGAHTRVLAGSADAVHVQEIDAAARGVIALLQAEDRLGDGEFVMALLGTGTAFAAVRDGKATHLGGTPLGGGSFCGIARRIDPTLTYDAMIAAAERGDRRNVDAMISDVYPEGIGRIGPDLTAAHLARGANASLDDFLAGLLNLHGENIAQIVASRATIASLPRVVLAGGFAHNNPRLCASIAGMVKLFGVAVESIPAPGYVGAIGAALIASELRLA